MKQVTLLATLLFVFLNIDLNSQTEVSLNGKELFGDMSARQIGPGLMSGRISDNLVMEGRALNLYLMIIYSRSERSVWTRMILTIPSM